MERLLNENAKNKYYFNVYQASEIDYVVLTQLLLTDTNTLDKAHRKKGRGLSRRIKSYTTGTGKMRKGILDICMSFDIETTSIDAEPKPYATMYIWQMGVNDNVIIGRHWGEFINILDLIKEIIQPSKNQRIFCAVHNLGFEFQFMRKWLDVTDAFLKDQRQPLYVEHSGFIQFRDTQALTNQSLKKLAETYTNTQKCAGDLDYSLCRTYESVLDSVELGYCYNDALILTEFMRYYIDTYISKGYAPLTATGILNKEVQDGFADMPEQFKEYIYNSHPQDIDMYNWLMCAVYRGGYVHGNELYIGKMLTEVDKIVGVDFTSSYPAVMLFMKYGYKFKKANIQTFQAILDYIHNDYAVLCELTFYDIRRTTAHSIESSSKCIELEGASIDNGRVAYARKMRVALTCQDILSYCEFYQFDYDTVEVHKVYVSKKEYLPRYLLNPLIEAYTLKNKLKLADLSETMEYKLAKSRVNSFYGLCVKKLPIARVCYDNNGWHVESGKDYEKNKENGLLPYFGVYISAYARRNLLSVVYKLESAGYPCIYMDTDSIKIKNYDKGADDIISAYDNHIKELTEDAKKRLTIGDLIDGLGQFDKEYGVKSAVTGLKCLGAKRYIITTADGKKNQTIAGLPKNILFELYPDDESVFNAFTNHMTVNNCKLCSHYNDNEITATISDYQGHTTTIHELSSVALLSTDFSMSINDLWLVAFTEYQKQFNTLERREI